MYYFDVHQIMQQEIPNLPQSEINKRISESWKGLSVAEKGYYLEKAKSEKEGLDTVRHILNFPNYYFLFIWTSAHLLSLLFHKKNSLADKT